MQISDKYNLVSSGIIAPVPIFAFDLNANFGASIHQDWRADGALLADSRFNGLVRMPVQTGTRWNPKPWEIFAMVLQ